MMSNAGYRSEDEMAKLTKARTQTELVIALGREGRPNAKLIDAVRYPHTVAMQAKFVCLSLNLRRLGAMHAT